MFSRLVAARFPALAAAALLSTVVLMAGCSKQAKMERHLSRAEKHFAAGEFEKASIEYRNVLVFNPTNSAAILRLARIFREQGLPMRAMQVLNESGLKPQDPVLQLLQAEFRFAQGERAEGRRDLVSLLTQNPTNVEALLFLASSAMGAQEITDTDTRLKQLAQQTGGAAPILLAQAVLVNRQGKPQEAEQMVQRVIQLAPNLAHAHAQMAQFHLSRTNVEAADLSLATAAKVSPLRSPFRVAYARAKASGGKLDEARTQLNEIYKEAPDYLPATMLLAAIELQGKKPDAAMALTDRLLRLDPANLEVRQLRSQIYFAQEKSDRAIREWEEFDQRIRPNPLVKMQLAQIHRRAGDSQAAINYLDQVIRMNTNRTDAISMEAQLLRARLSLDVLSPATVVEDLRAVLRRTNSVDARVLLVEALRRANRVPDAVSACRDLVKDYPQNPTFPFMLGTILRQQGNLGDARASFRRSLELAPGNLLSIYQLVDVEISAADQDAALRLIQTEAAKQTNSPALKYLEGRVYASRKQWPQAEASLKKCVEMEPNFSGAYQLLANIYLATTNLAGAAREMEDLVKKQPRNARALMMLGGIYEAMDKNDLARDTYEKLVAAYPDFVPGINNLAYLYGGRLNQLDKANELAQKASRLAPDDAAVADTLGWILYMRGEHQKALPYLLQAAEKFPSQPVIQYHLGVASYMLGQADTAKTALQRATNAPFPFKEKEDAQRYLAQLNAATGGAVGENLAVLEQRVKSQPKDLIARSLLAARYERDEQPQKAAAEYEEILRQNPRSAQATLRLAQLNNGPLKNPARALDLARKARDLAPNDPETGAFLGKLFYVNGDHAQAYNLLMPASQRLTTRADIQFDAAWAAFAVGKVAEADQAMRRTLQIDPQFKQADAAKWFAAMTALCLNPAGLAQAETQIQQLLKSDPNHGPALAAQAGLARAKGDSKSAMQLYQKVLTLFPRYMPATRDLALLYAADPAQAQKAYDMLVKVRDASPEDAETARALGIMAFQRKDYRYATTLLQSAIRAKADDAQALYYLGNSQLQTKDLAQGKANLQKAIAAGLKDPLLSDAKRLLTPPGGK